MKFSLCEYRLAIIKFNFYLPDPFSCHEVLRIVISVRTPSFIGAGFQRTGTVNTPFGLTWDCDFPEDQQQAKDFVERLFGYYMGGHRLTEIKEAVLTLAE